MTEKNKGLQIHLTAREIQFLVELTQNNDLTQIMETLKITKNTTLYYLNSIQYKLLKMKNQLFEDISV